MTGRSLGLLLLLAACNEPPAAAPAGDTGIAAATQAAVDDTDAAQRDADRVAATSGTN